MIDLLYIIKCKFFEGKNRALQMERKYWNTSLLLKIDLIWHSRAKITASFRFSPVSSRHICINISKHCITNQNLLTKCYCFKPKIPKSHWQFDYWLLTQNGASILSKNMPAQHLVFSWIVRIYLIKMLLSIRTL